MWLSRYIADQGTTMMAFAEKAGVAPSTVTRLLSQGVLPQRRTAEKLVAATDGLVLEIDLFAEASAARQKRQADGVAA